MFALGSPIVLGVLCFTVELTSAHRWTDKSDLWAIVSHGMMKDVGPNMENGEPLVVNHSINIQRLINLDNDMLTLSVWEMLQWTDPRLSWDPAQFGDIRKFRVATRSIWQPDIILYNSEEEYKGFVSGDLNAVVKHTGAVTFYPPRTTKTFCYINETRLQEDGKIWCILKYGSWTHSAQTLDLRLNEQPEIPIYQNRKWDIVNATAKRSAIKYSCCPETYLDLTYSLELKYKK